VSLLVAHDMLQFLGYSIKPVQPQATYAIRPSVQAAFPATRNLVSFGALPAYSVPFFFASGTPSSFSSAGVLYTLRNASTIPCVET